MKDLHAAYEFLKVVAFYDMKLPARVRLGRKNLRIAWGYYLTQPPTIEIASSIKDGGHLLKVMAHEMIHATLETEGAHDTGDHGEAFKAVAHVVCDRMGWTLKGF